MAVNYCYLPDLQLILACFWGSVSLADTPALRETWAADASIHDARALIIDATEVTAVPLGTQDIRASAQAASSLVAGPSRLPTAIIASADLVFGMARMYEALLSHTPLDRTLRVFRTWEEAQEWLQIDVVAAKGRARDLRSGPSLI